MMRLVVCVVVAGCIAGQRPTPPKKAPQKKVSNKVVPRLASFPEKTAKAVADVIAARIKGRDIYRYLGNPALSAKMPARLLLSVYHKGGVERLILYGGTYRDALLQVSSRLKPGDFRCFRLDQVVGRLPPADAAKAAETLRHGLDALRVFWCDGREKILFPDEIVTGDMVDAARWQVVLSVKFSGAAFIVMRVASYLFLKDGRFLALERLRRPIRSVNRQKVESGLKRAADYLIRNQQKNGLFLYLYYAGRNKALTGGYLIRHAFCATQLLRYGAMFADKKALEAANRCISALIKECRKKGTVVWLQEPAAPLARLGPAAVLLLALARQKETLKQSPYEEVAKGLAKFLLSMQRKDGSFNTYMDTESGAMLKRHHRFYPGEAVLALAVAGKAFGRKEWTEAAVKGMHAIFAERMRQKDFVDAWLLQAANILRRFLTPKEKQFCFAVADMLVESQRKLLGSGYEDYRGALGLYNGLPSCASDAAFGEGLGAVFALANEEGQKCAAKYAQSLRHLAAFLLRHQFDAVSGHFLAEPRKAFGGFSTTLFDTKVRCDVVAHAMATLMAVTKTWER